MATGAEPIVQRVHGSLVHIVAFSPDATHLGSASRHKTVRIWDTVPRRVRRQERQAVLAARPKAQLIVDKVWNKYSD